MKDSALDHHGRKGQASNEAPLQDDKSGDVSLGIMSAGHQRKRSRIRVFPHFENLLYGN